MGKLFGTFYQRPHGRKIPIELVNIYPEDIKYIIENKILVSIEEDGSGGFILYFDYGQVDKEGEPIEHIEISGQRDCKSTVASAIETIKKLKGENHG